MNECVYDDSRAVLSEYLLHKKNSWAFKRWLSISICCVRVRSSFAACLHKKNKIQANCEYWVCQNRLQFYFLVLLFAIYAICYCKNVYRTVRNKVGWKPHFSSSCSYFSVFTSDISTILRASRLEPIAPWKWHSLLSLTLIKHYDVKCKVDINAR